MIDDLIPIVRELPGRTATIWPVADVHIGSKECDLDGFAKLLKRIEREPDEYLVLVGDIINNGVKDSMTNVYEETMPPAAQLDKAVELLRPVADKVLGIVEGNHEARSRKAVDMSPSYAMACMLGIQDRYRQNMAFVRVRLAKGKVKDVYNLLLTHGATANKKRNFAYAVEGVDCFITGHTHDGIIEKPMRLVMDTICGTVNVRESVNVTATSWLKPGGYGLSHMYMPKASCDPQRIVLEWTGSNARRGKVRVTW